MGESDGAPWQGAYDEGQTRIASRRCSRLQRCRLRIAKSERKGRKEGGKKSAVCSTRRDKMQRAEKDGVARKREEGCQFVRALK